MPEFPMVDVILITYDRYAEIQQTLEALSANLIYPADKLRYLIADDATPGGYVAKLKKLKLFKDLNAEFVPAEANGGWGVNANRALRHSTANLIFQIEDDYVLTKPLDLRVGIALMELLPHLGMLRYRGTAGDHVVLHQLDADVSAYLPDHRDGMGLPGHATYMLLDSGSPTAYIYSNGPHLKRRAFHDFYGLYPEGLKLGATEEAYAMHVKDRMKAPGALPIGILPEWVIMGFDHIGKSWKETEADK